jgi:hypothetical protein
MNSQAVLLARILIFATKFPFCLFYQGEGLGPLFPICTYTTENLTDEISFKIENGRSAKRTEIVQKGLNPEQLLIHTVIAIELVHFEFASGELPINSVNDYTNFLK